MASPPAEVQRTGRGEAERLRALHGLRALAALYVVCHHVAMMLTDAALPRLLFRFGYEAVMVFFLLSGFVIGLSSRGGTREPVRLYALRRTVRIYPIFLCALLVTYLVACATRGRWIDPRPGELLGNLFMLQNLGLGRPGHWFSAYLGNHPLWSLSYEVWFYALFPLVIALRGSVARALPLVALVSVGGALTSMLFPNPLSVFASYFCVWWLGVSLAEEYRSTSAVSLAGQRGALGLLALLLALQAAHAARSGWSSPASYPWVVPRHFASALLFALLGLGVARHAALRARIATWLEPWAILAPISYAMYALHEPLMVHTALASPWKWPTVALGFVATLLLSYLLEVRLQPRLTRWALGRPGAPDAEVAP